MPSVREIEKEESGGPGPFLADSFDGDAAAFGRLGEWWSIFRNRDGPASGLLHAVRTDVEEAESCL
jgi:hypothetical protein